MVRTQQRSTNTNTGLRFTIIYSDASSHQKKPTLTDMQRIAHSLQRATLTAKYSHGTVKRRAMAMINHYLRLANINLAVREASRHKHAHHEMHVAM